MGTKSNKLHGKAFLFSLQVGPCSVNDLRRILSLVPHPVCKCIATPFLRRIDEDFVDINQYFLDFTFPLQHDKKFVGRLVLSVIFNKFYTFLYR